MPDYVSEIRKLIGSRPLILVGGAVLFIDEAGRLLLHLRRDTGTWGIPGGAMEPGERLEEAAAREAKEEVGLTCRSLQFFGLYSGPEGYYRYPHGDEVYTVSAVYLCRDFSGDLSVDEAEGITAAFFTLDSLPANVSPPIAPVLRDLLERRGEISPGDVRDSPAEGAEATGG